MIDFIGVFTFMFILLINILRSDFVDYIAKNMIPSSGHQAH